MRKLRDVLLVMLCLACSASPFSIYAETASYQVTDQETLLFESQKYEEAYRYYNEHLEESLNLLLKENGKIIRMEYGIVEFPGDKGCTINVSYHSTERDREDYLNPCYGTDALYLSSSKDSKTVYFRLSGDNGYADLDKVILHPFESLQTKPSYYHYENDVLSHFIKTDLTDEFIAYTIELYDAIGLPKGDYFSYDGHRFYDDFYLMSDDYRNNSYEHAVNEEAYYNYYQYLPYRSFSSYGTEELTTYFHESLGLDQRLNHYSDHSRDGSNDEVNRSQLLGTEGDFLACQYLYGTNAMLLLSSAINESAYGKSLKSYSRNNLFLSAAYATDIENETDRYATVSDSIHSFSRYLISGRFADHLRKDYSGTFLGNKRGGINVNYSLDPYYGEKVAATYGKLDRTLGNLDKNHYALGLIIDASRVSFYHDAQLKKLKYRLNNIHEASFILLDETEDSYKIRIDNSYSFDYLYDIEKSVAYVPKDVFSLILNPEKIQEEKPAAKHYDFNGGSYHGYSALDLNSEGKELQIVPVKKGYEFSGFDDQLVAQYREIRDIALTGQFSKMSLHEPIDLQGVLLSITYDDNEHVELPLNSDMIENYDPETEGEQDILIRYCGLEMNAKVTVSAEKDAIEKEIREAIDKDRLSFIKENIVKASGLSFNEIRKIDRKLSETSDRNYVISDFGTELDLGISGLDLSLPDLDTFIYVNDTYYVDAQKIRSTDEEQILKVASAYGFAPVLGIDLSFRFNYENIHLQGPAIVQLHIEGKKDGQIYSVYHLQQDGDILKCRTIQTKETVVFLIEEEGAYEVLEMPGNNDYATPDVTETLTKDSMGFDNHRINIGLLLTISFALAGISGIIVFYIFSNMRRRMWKDFRKSLQTAESVPVEKPKN